LRLPPNLLSLDLDFSGQPMRYICKFGACSGWRWGDEANFRLGGGVGWEYVSRGSVARFGGWGIVIYAGVRSGERGRWNAMTVLRSSGYLSCVILIGWW
jgi:hypothetical protein